MPPILTPCGERLFASSFAARLSRAEESDGLVAIPDFAAEVRLVGNSHKDKSRIDRFGALRSQAMKLERKKRAVRGSAEPAAVRVGLKPPGGGKLKWIRVGFAWDLFVLSPLLGIPLFLRKLPQWGAVILGLLLLWIVLGGILDGRPKWMASVAFAAIFFLIDLFLGFYGNRLTARSYLRHGWTVDHPDYAATRKVVARWKLKD
jgi:hypothetical protein